MRVFLPSKAIHSLHAPPAEIILGQAMPCFEQPDRISVICESLQRSSVILEEIETHPESIAMISQVHQADYLDFLQHAYKAWKSETVPLPDLSKEKLQWLYPHAWPIGNALTRPSTSEARAGQFMYDLAAPIGEGTFKAAVTASASVLAASEAILRDGNSAVVLTRPPGHHAGHAFAGGFCYINHTAVASNFLQTNGRKIAILDLDYHHGNGTQDIFWSDPLLFVSLHADPRQEYPYYWGGTDEIGEGPGCGQNLNLPLSLGTDDSTYYEALEVALNRLTREAPDVVVVSMGFDTYYEDPVGGFQLSENAYPRIAERLKLLKVPLLCLLEGGYHLKTLGLHTLRFLSALT